MSRNLRAGFVMLALMVAAGVALTEVLPLPHTPQFIIARLVFAGLAVAVILWFIFDTSDITPPVTTLGRPNPVPPSESEIADEYAAIMQSYDADTIALFSKILGNLPHYLTHIDEYIEILEDTPQLRVTKRQTYQIDKNSPPVFLAPLALVKKGILFDNFIVTDASGNEVSTLPYNRLRGLLAITLEILIKTAIRNDMGDRAVEEQRELVSKVLRDLVVAVCGPGPFDRLTERHPHIAMRIKSALDSISELPISNEWKRGLRDFCEQYVDYYIIVAEVLRTDTRENYLGLTYSHRIPFENINGSRGGQWRERFGLKPSEIDIPLNPNAFQVDTYHQEIAAEPGQYIFDHRLERLKSQANVTQDDLPRTAGFEPYVRLYHNEARPNAHLYIRRQVSPQSPSTKQPSSPGAKTSQTETIKQEEILPGPLKSVVRLREIPPGSLGAVTIIALASAMIISFFAITHMGLDIDPYTPNPEAEQIKAILNSDIPALLIALPAFVGVLIGSWLDLSRLRRASLTTYLALAATMFLSLTSALYFVFDANRKLPTSVTITAIGDMTIRTDWIWLALMIVSITHFLFLYRRLIDESHHYAECIKKRAECIKKRIDKNGTNSV